MLSPDFLFYFVSVSLLGSGYLFDCLKLPWLFPPVPHYLIYIYGLWFSLSCSNLLSPLFEWLDLYCMPCSICLIFVFNLIFCTVFLSESRFFFSLLFWYFWFGNLLIWTLCSCDICCMAKSFDQRHTPKSFSSICQCPIITTWQAAAVVYMLAGSLISKQWRPLVN